MLMKKCAICLTTAKVRFEATNSNSKVVPGTRTYCIIVLMIMFFYTSAYHSLLVSSGALGSNFVFPFTEYGTLSMRHIYGEPLDPIGLSLSFSFSLF